MTPPRQTYTVEIAGLTRHLPLFQVFKFHVPNVGILANENLSRCSRGGQTRGHIRRIAQDSNIHGLFVGSYRTEERYSGVDARSDGKPGPLWTVMTCFVQ